jgi:hypothetical protein
MHSIKNILDTLKLTEYQRIYLNNRLINIYIKNTNYYYKIYNILKNINPNLNKLKVGSFYIISKILKEYNNDDILENIISSLNIIVNLNESLHYYSYILIYRDPIKYSYYLNYINKEYFNVKLQNLILKNIYLYNFNDFHEFIISTLNKIKDYKSIYNSFLITIEAYKCDDIVKSKQKKLNYIIKLLKYVCCTFYLDDDIDYTFDSIYMNICLHYNRQVFVNNLLHILQNYNTPYKTYNTIMSLYDYEFIIYNKYDKLKKIYYIIKVLRYIDFNTDDIIYSTFDSIYKDICTCYNKKITLFKLAHIECKKTNQYIYTQFINKNI